MNESLNIKINVDAKTGEIKVLNSEFKGLGENATKTSKKLESVGSSLNSLRSSILSLATGFLTIKTAMDAISVADTFKNLEGRLSLVASSQNELTASTQALFQISKDTRQSFESTADLYYKLASSTKGLGYSQKELADVTKTISQSLIISGANSESASAALMQLGQGLASGTLRGEELNSVLEQSPRLAQMIADGMGITVGALRDVAAQGKITSEEVIEAVKSQADAVASEFAKMPVTVGQATTNVKTSIMELIANFDKATGASGSLANGIMDISNVMSDNKTDIIEFGRDIFSAWKLMGTGVVLLGEGVISGFELIASGFSEFIGRAELIGKQGLANMSGWVSDRINDIITLFENAYNQISSFFGGELKSFSRVDLRIDLGIEDSIKKLDSAMGKTDEIIAKRNENIKKYTDIIKNEFDNIANFRTSDIEKVELSDKKGKKVAKTGSAVATSNKAAKSKEQIAKDKEQALKKELDRQIEYYKAIGDLTNERLKKREKESIRLKELGLNDLQIADYFLKEEAKFEKSQQKERLQSLERYYELLGEKRLAAQQRVKIQALELEEQGTSKDEIANSIYGIKQRDKNYESISQVMGVDTGLAGGFMDKLNKIDEFHALEFERINQHYKLLEDIHENHIAKQNELDRLNMQTRMATAGAGFDALGGLAKMFYDASDGENKTALRAYQALMVGKAIVNTYTAASNAFATAGNPYIGAAMAAFAIAQGMAQVAQIKAQKFHSGGYVSSNLGSDEVNATLQTGEYVLSRKQVDNLRDDGAQEQSSGGIVIVNTLDNSVFEQWANSRNGKKVIKNVIGG